MNPFCGRCGRSRAQCEAEAEGGSCEQQHRFDPDRWCGVCGHRLDVQVFPDRVESACKVCRVRAARAGA
ncbi:hypothetical protein BH23ACT9_BH23ACT9_13340 [soil metagenome]